MSLNHGCLRLRISEIEVEIRLGEPQRNIALLERCIAQFEDSCVVTDSVRNGLPVGVKAVDGAGVEMFRS